MFQKYLRPFSHFAQGHIGNVFAPHRHSLDRLEMLLDGHKHDKLPTVSGGGIDSTLSKFLFAALISVPMPVSK